MSIEAAGAGPANQNEKVNWVTTTFFGIFHVGALAAPFFFEWRSVIVAVVLYWITIGWGIGMGYHRLHTHRAYVVPKWLEHFFALCGTLTMEGGPIFWVATHRIHHQHSDLDGDPHTPRHGKWWSHMGWILFGEAKHNQTQAMMKYTPDLAKDNFYLWLNTYHWVPIIVLSAILYLWGGLSMFLWATCVRVVLGLHSTWLVNSASHLWGGRRFNIRDDSRNNWWVAILTFGEGWHNNHHAHPNSARHGLAWYEYDQTWLQIRLLEKLGIARNVKVAHVDTPSAMERRAA
ncbi:MAG: fatty acid desaturase [Acidobacteria bacterium]|jgi:fatty-acid desaturase|nr:fatty acid desaturase [Acidobacteriota bacterium]